MALTQDTPLAENEETHPNDPHQTGSGNSQAPGGASAPAQTQQNQTQGQESYPGPRAAGEDKKDTPIAGDVDPGSNASAEETGQQGDTSKASKNTGNAWNG